MKKLLPIVEFIKNERRAQGLTQRDFAALIGANAAMISNWETGQTMPSLESLDRIAKLLDCEVGFVPTNPSDRSRKNNRILSQLRDEQE